MLYEVITPFTRDGIEMVRFGVHPQQKRGDAEVICEYPVKDYRQVSDSGGHKEMRYVIETEARLGDRSWNIEMTLTNRDSMKFRMLLGRTAMRGILVNPKKSFLVGREPAE